MSDDENDKLLPLGGERARKKWTLKSHDAPRAQCNEACNRRYWLKHVNFIIH